MYDNSTSFTCLCSTGVWTTLISIACGTISNVVILILLFKSKMMKDTTGKILTNEAVADILLDVCMGIMMCMNVFERRIQMYGFPIGTGLSCIKAFSLMGISAMLYLAICCPLFYKIHVLPQRVNVTLACLWIWIPLMVGCVLLDGTFYKLNEVSGCINPYYTSTNWWIGGMNFVSILCLPVVVIAVCAVKIIRHHSDLVLMGGQNCNSTTAKVWLAKLTVILFVLTVLSQVPLHITAALHVTKKPILAASSLLYFVYPCAKLFFYLYTLRNFRRTAERVFGCCRKQKSVKGSSFIHSSRRSTISTDTRLPNINNSKKLQTGGLKVADETRSSSCCTVSEDYRSSSSCTGAD